MSLVVFLRPGERLRQAEEAVHAQLLRVFEFGCAAQC